MRKWISHIVVGVVGLAAGYGLACLLRSADTPPPSGFQSRVVDSIPGKSIIEFFGEQLGIDMRLRYLRDERGTRPLTLGDLSWYIAAKHGGDSASRAAAIRDFIKLYNPRETLVLTSAQDIPGFRRDQLDPDLRGLSLAPLDTQDGRATISIVYTWTRIGGVLTRYRFRTHPGHAPYCYSCILLQGGLGEAAYLG